MSSFELGVLFVLVWFGVYVIIHRICSCIEHCATGKAYAERIKNQKEIDSDDEK